MFPALVVSLLQRQETPQFSIDSESRTYERQLRYGVKLNSKDLLGTVLLVDNFKCIEVYFTGPQKECPIVRLAITKAMSICTELLLYDVDQLNAVPTLVCRQKHRKDDGKLHGISFKYVEGCIYGNCLVESEIAAFKVIDERQLCWLKGECMTEFIYHIVRFYLLLFF